MVGAADLLVGARFLRRLPTFLRRPIGAEEARQILRRRLERRVPTFLTLVKRAIYEHPGSPYKRLLEAAGCEYGDLERLVAQDGIEGALYRLFRLGVYLTVEELKGRRPLVRGGVSVLVDPGQLRNPLLRVSLWGATSGSRGPRTMVPVEFDGIRDGAVNKRVVIDARGGEAWCHALWYVPGAAVATIVGYGKAGLSVAEWFSPVDPVGPELHPRYRWSARAARWGSLLAGRPLPFPRHVPSDAPMPIVQWMADVLAAGKVPHLITYASAAVRLCQVALDSGIRLHRGQFTLLGEPTTEARLAVIRRTGAEAVPGYTSAESGRIGDGCLAPPAPDDVHLFRDLFALIQPGSQANDESHGLPPEALLISGLTATASLVLLNVSLGDSATLSDRRCGCPMETPGWTTHLSSIRSFEKLTAGGMTFLDVDVVRVLEEVLPSRFGGAPTDYQLIEEEAEDGQPRLTLLVHPAIGPLDPDAVVEAFHAAISPGSGVERVMSLLWRGAHLLRVERRAPVRTASGKILHLHLDRGRPGDPAPHGRR